MINVSVTEWAAEAVLKAIQEEMDKDASRIADEVLHNAQGSTAFKDLTGTLRQSINKEKSKFENGGDIVIATAPHSHLIEFGHGGKHPAGPKPFLRPAKTKAISMAKQITGAK